MRGRYLYFDDYPDGTRWGLWEDEDGNTTFQRILPELKVCDLYPGKWIRFYPHGADGPIEGIVALAVDENPDAEFDRLKTRVILANGTVLRLHPTTRLQTDS